MKETLTKALEKIHRLFELTTSSRAHHRLLDVNLATATSIRLSVAEESEPVWLLDVGPPSGGKTHTVLPLKGDPVTVFVDTLTPEAFVSGYRADDGARATHLLSEVNHKRLVVKDLTTLFSLRGDKIKKILGDMQSIFDGEFAKSVGTSTDPTTSIIQCPSKFSFIGCITRQAFERHQRYLSIIGSRFLVFRLPRLTPEEEARGFERAAGRRQGAGRELRKLIHAHIRAVGNGAQAVTILPEQDQILQQASRLIARGRTPAMWDVTYDPDDGDGLGHVKKERTLGEPEAPFRVYKQLRTLLRAIAALRGRDCPTKDDMAAVLHVARSTVLAARAEVLDCLRASPVAHEGKRGITSSVVVQYTRLSDDQARNRLDDMAGIGLFVKTTIEGDDIGNNVQPRENFYYPVPEFEPLILDPLDDAGTEETCHELTPV